MSERKRDPETGRYKQKITKKDVLERLKQDGEPKTAREISKKLNVSHPTVLEKLNELNKEKNVNRKEVGANSVIWWMEGE